MGKVLRSLAQNVGQGCGRDQHQEPEPNQFSTFKDFLDTKPFVFKEAEEPLQSDEWLNTIEQKFHLLRLTEHLKTEYALHQLDGPAGIWWSHHRSTLPKDAQITWNQFKATFRGHYIPLGLMSMKHTEFMRLTQGTKTLTEYLHAFNNLSWYAIEFMDTDAKKIASFKRGLSPKLMKTLANNKSPTFNEFISDALTQENHNNIYRTSKNRKRAFEVGAILVQSSYRPGDPSSALPAPKYRPPQKKAQPSQN
ncbi:uncharacterized protein [Miscanthus floridulus]|uniref:uncharacterized protein n=1 Tax=Miscanthus floridulus TaxID=154761 RepID=UPI00345AB725